MWYKDSSGNVSSTASDSITLDTTAPIVTITSPTSSSTYATTDINVSLGGSASDAISVVSSVTWSSSNGGSGTASGTTSWTISNISLSNGDTTITVTATDGAGNTGTDIITVKPSTLGTLFLSKKIAYLSGDTIVATVVDTDRNTDSNTIDTIQSILKITGVNYSIGSNLNLSLVEVALTQERFLRQLKQGPKLHKLVKTMLSFWLSKML